MNVSKIQRLSNQHEALEEFLKVCNHNNVELTVKVAGQSVMNTLGYPATKLIISELRTILLKRIQVIEKNIKEAISDG